MEYLKIKYEGEDFSKIQIIFENEEDVDDFRTIMAVDSLCEKFGSTVEDIDHGFRLVSKDSETGKDLMTSILKEFYQMEIYINKCKELDKDIEDIDFSIIENEIRESEDLTYEEIVKKIGGTVEED